MQSTPTLLSDNLMPIYKTAMFFSFILGIASILVGFGYMVFANLFADVALSSAAFSGFILFLKGAGLAASISFVSFFAFWKRHEIKFNNCRESKSTNCTDIGLFHFA